LELYILFLNKMFNKKIIFNLILIFSIFVLVFAYYVQYVLKHQPCNLCLMERIPYILAIIITTISLFLKKFEKIYIILLFIIFVSSTLLSFYHFGIEQSFIKESFVCDLNTQTNSLTKEDLLTELQKNKVSCKDVTFRVIGLSLATINTIISLLLSVITIILFFKYDKNR